ncbi:MAG: M42 family peptidase [Planctomycetota bacterium]|nr:MAG: M42 family peptidase [Planctomycetota bacterium]
MYELLEKLIHVPGIPGYEHKVRELIAQSLPEGVETATDNMGNLIATIGNGDNAILFAAHMDELGFVITEVRDDGFLKIKPLGGTDPRTVFGRVLRIITETGEIKGAIGVKPPHLMTERDKDMNEIVKITDMVVDIGATDKAEAEKLGVGILDFAVIEKPFHILNEKFLCARALDDRLGCFIQIEAIKRLQKEKLSGKAHFAFTVQEEVGLRGATLIGRTHKLDMAFAIDSASSGDIPQARIDLGPAKLGKGAALRVLDNRVIIPPAFTKEIYAVAQEADIPCQIVFTGGGTDVAPIQTEGPRVIPLAFPLRYTHSAVEMVHADDVESITRLVCTIVKKYVG